MKCYCMMGFVFAVSLACLTGTVRADIVPNGEFNTLSDVEIWSFAPDAGGGLRDWVGNGESYASPDGKCAALYGASWLYRPGCTTGPAFVEGQQYQMSFLARNIAGPSVTLQAGITTGSGDEHNTQFSVSNTWQSYSVVFTTVANDVNASFQPQFLGATGTRFGIDNVSVSAMAVPEPTSMGLLGTSLLGLLAYAWRKAK